MWGLQYISGSVPETASSLILDAWLLSFFLSCFRAFLLFMMPLSLFLLLFWWRWWEIWSVAIVSNVVLLLIKDLRSFRCFALSNVRVMKLWRFGYRIQELVLPLRIPMFFRDQVNTKLLCFIRANCHKLSFFLVTARSQILETQSDYNTPI